MTTPARQQQQQEWEQGRKRWLDKEHCDVCGADFSRKHRKRHNESLAHQQALLTHWKWMPSDEMFAQFLRSISGRQLRGYERRLFQHYREEGIPA